MGSTSKICLCLNGRTIKEDLELIEKYRRYIDIAEFRVDYLDDDEKLQIRKFPELAGLPVILTIRRRCDGGNFIEGESNRTVLFALGLSYADQDSRKNFAYVDMENDFDVPSLQDAALAFGTKIIRSYHNMEGPVKNLEEIMQQLRKTGFEIPKVACMPNSLSDATNLMVESQRIKNYEHIAIAMGPFGLPSRILASKINSCITYVSPTTDHSYLSVLGQIDPIAINEIYNFRKINDDTAVYGIIGYPLTVTNSPMLHNNGFKRNNIDGVYIPIRSHTVQEAEEFAQAMNIRGLSVTIPFKSTFLQAGLLSKVSETSGEVQAVNTAIMEEGGWSGYNTDVDGFILSFLNFVGRKNLFGKRIAIIGAGGAARAIAYAIKKHHGKACIFNRTLYKAKEIADYYNFKYAVLSPESLDILKSYSDYIIQTTPVGLGLGEGIESDKDNDPIHFYSFKGNEKVFDIVYNPKKTPMLLRAEKAGCDTINGEEMFNIQGYEQFELFTGKQY